MQPKLRKQTDQSTEAILRMSNAVEGAPYTLEAAKLVDVELAASCSPDSAPLVTKREPDSTTP